jgi:hypothetical protein
LPKATLPVGPSQVTAVTPHMRSWTIHPGPPDG